MNDELHQIWDGAPQCPICDGPLKYYTDAGEDMDPASPCGEIMCCQCAWEYFALGLDESMVLDKLFARVRETRLKPHYRFRSEEELER